MHPIIFKGLPAFSNFRLKALQGALNKSIITRDIVSIEAFEVFFIEAKSPLNEQILQRTCTLLKAQPYSDRSVQKTGFFVTPRKGTISAWSSKATDIFHNCGLKEINRVERGVHFRITDATGDALSPKQLAPSLPALHDRMTEGVYGNLNDFFSHFDPAALSMVPLIAEGRESLVRANIQWGLALSPEDIDYLTKAYRDMGRDPSDAELVMFSQVNSEHCRHKIFNADWIVDGQKSQYSLFKMIQNTYERNPEGVLVAYSDNSGVFEGHRGDWWEVSRSGMRNSHFAYRKTPDRIDIICKVESHNHPTAISPFPGAATGVGGEIRDEGATGIGGRPKAGLSGFMVSHLRIPDYLQAWETPVAEHPERTAGPLDIMIEGPIGGAAFGNEFGRPQICGFFRTFERVHNGHYRGYHKPIMIAGGMGNLRREHIAKKEIPPAALILQIGGPAMKIGLGGGAASSIRAGTRLESLDFDSVQRGNPEMQRRCQQVIDACIAMGAENPILSIHDIGAGGLSNGLPELVEATGGHFQLRNIHNQDRSMSPMEIWCNEAQERYIIAINPGYIEDFETLCKRERCPLAIVGEATSDGKLVLEDAHFKNNPIDIEMGILLGKPPKLLKEVTRQIENHAELKLSGIQLTEAINRVLRFPAVANKSFLITIADRTITGMVTRDQMVGPWQTPVADVAVTSTTMDSYTGESMAVGERTPLAILNAPASGRMAIGECLTNIAASNVGPISNVKLSANWMVASGESGQDADLFDTVRAVGMELCPALGISIPVGKDSMSMCTTWKDSKGKEHKQTSPLSLIVSGFSKVADVRKTLTPDLKSDNSHLLLLDLGAGKNRLGGSCLAQVYNQLGRESPDLEDTVKFSAFFNAIQQLIVEGLILSYHDRSDGGLVTGVAEMCFAGGKGVSLILDKPIRALRTETASPDPTTGASHPKYNPPTEASMPDIIGTLFSEELGAIIEVDRRRLAEVSSVLARNGINDISHLIGHTHSEKTLNISLNGQSLYSESITTLKRIWSELTFKMQSERDHPTCAREEFDSISDENTGPLIQPNFDPDSVFVIPKNRPKVAIFRDQGINGQNEMAFAFDRAGFECVDVHMTDLLNRTVDLKNFSGLVACGGFSYGDVLGAGFGWAKSILCNARIKDMFETFFKRDNNFTLGVCNGCQMISHLKDIIPGAKHWPQFKRNRSEQFEARYANVEVLPSPSIFFRGMEGSRLPIPVAHGEGYADFTATGHLKKCVEASLISIRYIDFKGNATETYPANPNGSPDGVTGFTTADGRSTILMPHPERLFRSVQMSYRPQGVFEGESGPWLKMFQNARNHVA